MVPAGASPAPPARRGRGAAKSSDNAQPHCTARTDAQCSRDRPTDISRPRRALRSTMRESHEGLLALIIFIFLACIFIFVACGFISIIIKIRKYVYWHLRYWLWNELDLHGLTIRQAEDYVRIDINKLRQGGRLRVFITGQGHHSPGGVARIKPAIEELLTRERIWFKEATYNPGRLIAYPTVGPHRYRY